MGDLPVDLDRLKAEFPELTDEELQAYVTVTRRVMSDPAARAKTMREVCPRRGQRSRRRPPAGSSRRRSSDWRVT